MLKERPKGRVAPAKSAEPVIGGRSRIDLIRLLQRLIEQVGDPSPTESDSSVSVAKNSESWQDEAYDYIEVNLAGCSIRELDLSVTNGRAYIRVGR